jgi:hypothetical protein
MITRAARVVVGTVLVAFALVTFVGIVGGQTPAWAQEELFVTNAGSADSITVYPRTANGNVAPIRTLQGAATGLDNPQQVVVDTVNNELVVTNIGISGLSSVRVYSRTANGNVAPIRTLQGAATGLSPTGLAVDTINNELLVANPLANTVTVYPRTANGNVAPIRTLQGAATGLNGPSGLSVDPVRDELVVANFSNHSITVYPRTANGNVAPIRTLQGAATGLDNPSKAIVDRVNDELVVLNFVGSGQFSSITVYPRTASGNTAPLRTITGAATGLFESSGLVVDTVNNEINSVNGDLSFSSVTAHNRTASGNVAPKRGLIGGATGLNVSQGADITTATPPRAEVGLNGSVFHTGQTITYRAILTPGSTPAQVDIYLGALLPDFATFLSLVQTSPGVISVALGPSPIPFLANQTLGPLKVEFSFTFGGAEPVGTYFTFAGLAVAGSNPFIPANQLSLAVQPFQFSP